MLKSIVAMIGVIVALVLVTGLLFWPLIIGLILVFGLKISAWWLILFTIVTLMNIYVLKRAYKDK